MDKIPSSVLPAMAEPEDELKCPAMYSETDDRMTVTGFMCRIDWECEIGGASGGNRIYPTIEDLRS